jgi:hypothetical protein
MTTLKSLRLLSNCAVIVVFFFSLQSCKKDTNNNNNSNNSTTPTLQSQVIGTWKLVKEHWQISNNQDTVLTSWSTSTGSSIPTTIEFGSQVLGQWYSGGLDNMFWGGPSTNPFTRGSGSVNALWAIEANTNRLVGAAYAKYDVVYIDANSMVLSQENLNNQYSFDTLWLEKL